MKKIKNTQNIEHISMFPVAYTKCVIGQDWYKNEIEISIIPSDCYPDYMEIDEWIMKEIDGQELNIEDVVAIIYEKIETEFHPHHINVVDHIKGCKTHFNVTVSK